MTGASLMHEAGHSKGQPRGMGWGERLGGALRMVGYMCTHGCFMSMYGKNHHNILIILQLK